MQDIRIWAESSLIDADASPPTSPGGRSVEDTPVPDCISRAVAALWEAQARRTEEIEAVQADLRELIQRRHTPPPPPPLPFPSTLALGGSLSCHRHGGS
jgi:hypothetical protein